MLRSLTSAISGLQSFQQRMDVIGNNIANVNTTGFKSGRVDYSDSFSQTLRESVTGTATTTGSSSMQIGSGVATGAIRNIYSQGAVSRTGVQTDLAIAGEGYFVVRDTVSNLEYATRAGDFRVDENGYLVTNGGQRLQGLNDTGLSAVGDLKIDLGDHTPENGATISSWSIDQEGKINISLSDGSQFVRGQIRLQNFRDPQALVKEGNNLYSGMKIAGPMVDSEPTDGGRPGTAGLGSIQAGALELSNVDLANEFSTMITAQRAFQASARMISTSDEVLQELVNLKR